MRSKRIVTAVLLLFVAVSVVYLVARETGVTSKGGETLSGREDQGSAGRNETLDEGSSGLAPAPATVVAYYFHGKTRCKTCLTIEAYAKEAIETGFADELKKGTLVWRVVDVEDPENEHYVEEFELSTRSVVLERIGEGKRQEWKNLNSVWELVYEEKESFIDYIQEETEEFLEAVEK
ncbi:MAG: hypothetical protein JW814_05635 [Candidatus Krumholzibacteriota bacterium]|nr:hypothetical protein [Candidatus Krumholzibacteriota bacterium]